MTMNASNVTLTPQELNVLYENDFCNPASKRKDVTSGVRVHVVVHDVPVVVHDEEKKEHQSLLQPHHHATIAYFGDKPSDAQYQAFLDVVVEGMMQFFKTHGRNVRFVVTDENRLENKSVVATHLRCLDPEFEQLMNDFVNVHGRLEPGMRAKPAEIAWHIARVQLPLGTIVEMTEVFIKRLGPVDPYVSFLLC